MKLKKLRCFILRSLYFYSVLFFAFFIFLSNRTQNELLLFNFEYAQKEISKTPIYFINLNSSITRRQDLENDYLLLQKSFSMMPLRRIPALTVDDVKAMLKTNKFLLNNKIILAAPERRKLPRIYKYQEAACTLSHLITIKQAYEEKQEVVIIVEDDILLTDELAKQWTHLEATAPGDWSILQLSTSNELVNRRDLHLHNDLWINWDPSSHWGALAYAINRKGMLEILSKTYDYHSHTWELNEPFVLVSDEIIFYSVSRSYTSTYPWIKNRDVETTIPMNKGRHRDLTFGQSKIKPNLHNKQARKEKVAVVISCKFESKDSIFQFLQEIRIDMEKFAQNHPESKWFFNVFGNNELLKVFEKKIRSLPLPLELELFGTIRKDENSNKFKILSIFREKIEFTFDYVLFKDSGLRFAGFPWNTFLNFSRGSIISGPFISNTKKSLYTKIKIAGHNPRELVHFQDATLFNFYTSKHFQTIYNKSIPFLDTSFALVKTNFLFWLKEEMHEYFEELNNAEISLLWCGASQKYVELKRMQRSPCSIVSINAELNDRETWNIKDFSGNDFSSRTDFTNNLLEEWRKSSQYSIPYLYSLRSAHICERKGFLGRGNCTKI